MAEQEGVIKFDLRYRRTTAEDTWAGVLEAHTLLRNLDGWRAVLRRLALLGSDPDRYDGYGFGNLSHRLTGSGPAVGRSFVISGSQTGHLPALGKEGWARVDRWDAIANRIEASGPIRPSSESLTHAAVYDAVPAARAVLHVHSPELWGGAADLGLQTTGDAIPYGTPEMAAEVARLVVPAGGGGAPPKTGLFVMAGHEDGVVAWGPSLSAAGTVLVTALGEALALGST
ncbi:MAG: class II aldolase/adducin family protein [Acidobacteriota bacterium]